MVTPTPLHLVTPSEERLKVPSLFGLDAAPPHALIERKSCYSIVFNMFGVNQKGIGIDVDVEAREVTVLARKESRNLKGGYFWVFGVPTDALMSEMTSKFKRGTLEILIPKLRLSALAAGA